jgi:Putative Actinobacterial Holin-X, holin superfamily III
VFPIVRDVKERIDTAVKMTGWCVIAGAAALVMLGFFCAALFLWIVERNGPIVACLVLGGVFLLIMIIAAIALANVRRRRAQRARLARANASAQWWRDPAVIATGLQVGRTLGAGRALPLVLLGAFALGLVLSRPGGRSGKSPGPAAGS